MSIHYLENANGLKAKISSRGGTIMELHVPDREGRFADVTLGFDAIEEYQNTTTYFGALVGRYGNRIAKGSFSLDGEVYSLAINNGENHLHGGLRGFDKIEWSVVELEGEGFSGLRLEYRSADMEEGYPGSLDVAVIYRLTDNNELAIEYEATTDRPTVVNLTQHAYFNLAGHDRGSVLDHEIKLNADRFTPVDKGLIPTGELLSVERSPFDFRAFKPIGKDINEQSEQLSFAGGYDHNFVLNQVSQGLNLAAEVREPKSKRIMKVYTNEPGVQFYTGNFLDGSDVGKGGAKYEKNHGFCLETQHFPDSPNQPQFPSTRLDPGQLYSSKTVYEFGVDEV